MKRLVLFACTLLVCSAHIPLALADDGVLAGISVSPMFQEVALSEGQAAQTFFIDASNTTASLVTLRLSVLDFGSLDESGGVAFLGAEQDFEKQYSIASWIRLDRDALVLSPNETQKVAVTFENRESLSPGGHYGAVIFKVENSGAETLDENGKPNIAISQSFSSLIFAKKLGGEIYNVSLRDIAVERGWLRLPESITLRFQNTGNVHLSPRGLAEVTDPLGNVIQKGVLNQESALILPETLRSYVIRPETLQAAFIPGYYTLTTQYRYDGKEEFIAQKQRFVYVPLWELGGLLGCVAIVLWWKKVKKKK